MNVCVYIYKEYILVCRHVFVYVRVCACVYMVMCMSVDVCDRVCACTVGDFTMETHASSELGGRPAVVDASLAAPAPSDGGTLVLDISSGCGPAGLAPNPPSAHSNPASPAGEA